MRMLKFLLILFCFFVNTYCGSPEEEGVKYADKCEVCKVVAIELQNKLDETGKTSDAIEIGYSLDEIAPKKKIAYKKSELRLIESLEDVCTRILDYNIHKERSDSSRFSKGMSQTFKTLHGLVDKGVKVDLGIPYELWDKPSVEITTLKTQCEELIENHEPDIEEWYFNHSEKVPLSKYLCSERYLKELDDSCLKEKGDTGKFDAKKTGSDKVQDEL
ncbi:hypothetical protein TKK_0017299 [Trichogramma kaykai]